MRVLFRTLPFGVATLALAACGGDGSQPTAVPSSGLAFATAGVADTGEVEVCKFGTDAMFSVSIDGGAPSSVSLTDGSCQVVGDLATYGVGIHTFTISEVADPAVVFDSIVPWRVTVANHTPVKLATVTVPTYSGTFSGDVGTLLNFYNEPAPPPPPGGCTGTVGYWKNHLNLWPAGYDPDAIFFTSGKTWLEILNTPTRGSAYIILADQYIAATLGVASGASAPASVTSALSQATAYFTDPGSSSLTRSELLALASLLNDYNNGVIGPGHCGV